MAGDGPAEPGEPLLRPDLLAAEEAGPRTDWRPVTLDAHDIGRSLTGDPASLRFSADGVAFKPFYESYGWYSAYLHVTKQQEAK